MIKRALLYLHASTFYDKICLNVFKTVALFIHTQVYKL